ncbi:spinocerebellar ataxia type 10 protein domain-containing protein [Sporodiniella umbellata]|nr:spinocerebellar ataxia type 10 protein domain-containing protein [Sporodiniella umbellata]
MDTIWQDWMSNKSFSIWSNLLSSNKDDLITSVLILMVNCTKGSESRCNAMVESGQGRRILGCILDDLERLHDQEECRNFELGYTIFNELYFYGHFKLLYSLFKDNLATSSLRQTVLLKILDSKIHGSQEKVPSFIHASEIQYLSEQFKAVAKKTKDVIVSVKESQETSKLQVEDISNTYTAVILLLQILNQILVFDTKNAKPFLVKIDAITLVIDILGHLQSIQLPPGQDDRPELGFNFLKRECVRMIGTLCYEDRSMQDKARELSGIPLVLEQLKIDDSNPYLREYATLALRNLMKDNAENQNVIHQLEPQQVLQSDELTKMGITPELLNNGKVRINKTEL